MRTVLKTFVHSRASDLYQVPLFFDVDAEILVQSLSSAKSDEVLIDQENLFPAAAGRSERQPVESNGCGRADTPVITFDCTRDLDTPSPPKCRPPKRYCDWPYAYKKHH